MPSQRLLVIASMCPDHGSLVDIGSDHGLLIQLLLKQGFSSSLFASELSQDSLQHLKHQLVDLPVKVYHVSMDWIDYQKRSQLSSLRGWAAN